MAAEKAGFSQRGHAHRSKHGSTKLDPSHESQSPSLGIRKQGLPNPRDKCRSAVDWQAVLT
ncbi:hypothetical protein A6X21_06845 [Planctopirus hydrillae]|uniref:Uncharacterized protein n=1 Tax=Planctopirus hydrillae TaxID=1841610 RepID=A0A1C3EA18_9PLAN|nr:hypothetical protein A6X21_06845 [Planctopirus hydrillae]